VRAYIVMATVIRSILAWWLLNTVVLGVAVALIGSVSVTGAGALIAAGFVLGVLNAFLKPFLKIIGVPLALVTFGLSLFLINIVIIWLTGVLVSGLHLGGFVGVIETTIVVWLASIAVHLITGITS
jgi:putative membrane protein